MQQAVTDEAIGADVNVYFQDHKAEADLGRQTLRGGAITIVARAINAVVQVGSVLFLARLLSPEDYGLVAMVTAVTGFAPVLVDFGTRDAIVQRARITQGEVSALFWIAVGVGVFFAASISAAGPLIAAFYNEPRLRAIVFVSSLSFVASALVSQHQALLRRAVRFRELAIVDITANVLSAIIAIVMAFSGLKYWALVTRPVAMYFITAIGVWCYCRWVPVKPTMTTGVKDMVKFGVHLTGFSLTDFAGRNGDRVAVGRTLGAITLGFYQNAMFVYDNLIDVLVYPLHQVAVAGLSKLQNDRDELKRLWAKALSTVAFYAMPAFGLLAVTSRELIVLLLGPKWANAGILLSVLALRGIPHSVERTLGWLHVAAARTDRWFRWGVVATCGQLLALLCGLPFGTMGVAWAYVIFMYIAFLPALAYAGRPLQIGARDVIRVVGAQLAAVLIATTAGFALRNSVAGLPAIERVAVLAVSFCAIYLVLVVGVFRATTPVEVCLSLVRDFLPAPFKSLASFRFVQSAQGIGRIEAVALEPGEKSDLR
jgi:PST family polysaccharide transporter